eukprot:CAMPEP_0184504722 /NCGR_PEP_ID=MMETSP0113_2-20130426/52614_1 /TAXON_ID=91329 /ORGANISM="Norrisiella sphaerica, Strain BC52" /LENGTH=169 /DNA_ID=CAMNT_0026894379 /DNA_START=512 /DNA_END=1019 /DNA_ORIENTATION=+
MHLVRLFSRKEENSSEKMYYITTVEGALEYVLNADPKDFHGGRSPFKTPAQTQTTTPPHANNGAVDGKEGGDEETSGQVETTTVAKGRSERDGSHGATAGAAGAGEYSATAAEKLLSSSSFFRSPSLAPESSIARTSAQADGSSSQKLTLQATCDVASFAELNDDTHND